MSTIIPQIELIVTSDQSIDTTKLNIDFSELGFHTTIYPIYVDGIPEIKSFPVKAGIYTLFINYADELCYQEVAYYRTDPLRERLTFHFFGDSGKLLCRISSFGLHELNKLILMNPVDHALQDVLVQNK